MIRSIVLHDIPLAAVPAMERWYWREHSPEIVRRYGPWTARHDSYLPVEIPAEARSYGFFNWRLTEGWWRQLPKPGPQGALSFTPPPVWPKVAACFTPWQPSEDFLGWERLPSDPAPLRWFTLWRYPDGVSAEEGEAWFQSVHAPETARQPGLVRYFSYRTVDPGHLPGTWAPASAPPLESVMPRWDRVCELWYESFDAWKNAVIDNPPAYTAPTWASHPAYPFLRPGRDFVCSFILERPTDEFLRDSRAYL
jgi:hypothetical protein